MNFKACPKSLHTFMGNLIMQESTVTITVFSAHAEILCCTLKTKTICTIKPNHWPTLKWYHQFLSLVLIIRNIIPCFIPAANGNFTHVSVLLWTHVVFCGRKGQQCAVDLNQVLQTAVWMMGRGDTWGGATRVAPPTPNSIGLYGKSHWCRPEHVHSFVYDFVKLIWPYYRNIMF